jgi:CRP-like cAMP-binding protein
MAHGLDKKAWVTTLRSYPVFADLGDAELKALVEAGTEFHLPAGWPLVQEGIPADAVYILSEGQARVFYERRQVATVGIGDGIGEMALLEGGQRKATVTSSDRIAGLRIENDKMREVMKKYPAITNAFRAVYTSHSNPSDP